MMAWSLASLGPFLFTTRAFIWTAAAGMRAITPDTVSAVATSITNGRVVGWYASGHERSKNVLVDSDSAAR